MFTKQLLCALFQLQGLSLWSKTPFLTGGGGGGVGGPLRLMGNQILNT